MSWTIEADSGLSALVNQDAGICNVVSIHSLWSWDL